MNMVKQAVPIILSNLITLGLGWKLCARWGQLDIKVIQLWLTRGLAVRKSQEEREVNID